MTDNSDKDYISTLRQNTQNSLKDAFENLGGEAYRRRISARWSNNAALDARALEIDLEKEIVNAMTTEIGLETVYDLFNRVRAVPAYGIVDYRQFDGDMWAGDAHKRAVASFLTALSKAPAGSVAIISPTVLTVIQSASVLEGDNPAIEFVRISMDQAREKIMDAFSVVGHVNGNPVVVDPYANDTAKPFIAEPGWFTYSSLDGAVVDLEQKIDDQTGEPVQSFESNLMTVIHPSRVKVYEVLGIAKFA